MARTTTQRILPRSFLLVCGVLTLTACASAPRQGGMYWGNYEASLYRLADTPSERVQQQHLSNLRQVVEVSEARGWPPPPGAMLELAIMEQQIGNSDAYALLVNREYHLYPESRPFILRWFSDVMVTAKDTENNNTEPTGSNDDVTNGGVQ